MPNSATARKRQVLVAVPPGIDPSAIYDFRQFISVLQISPATGWRLVSKGPKRGGIAVCRVGRRTLIRGQHIIEFLDRCETGA